MITPAWEINLKRALCSYCYGRGLGYADGSAMQVCIKYLTENKDDIVAHKSAKKYFYGLGLEMLPTINTLKAEYAALLVEKKKLYTGYRQSRMFMQDVLAARQNAEALLRYRGVGREKESERV
jgi:hypothetical protein